MLAPDSTWRRYVLIFRESGNVSRLTGASRPQTPAKAIAFYEDKVKNLEANLTELEKIVQTKSSQQRLFEDGKPCFYIRSLYLSLTHFSALRQKLLSENAPSTAAAAGGG